MLKPEVWLTISGVAATALPAEKASVARARQEESRKRFASKQVVFMMGERLEGREVTGSFRRLEANFGIIGAAGECRWDGSC